MSAGPYPPIAELIPHRGEAILLTQVLEFSESRIVCAACPSQGCPYTQGGRIPALVALELVAQAVAAMTGMERRTRGESSRGGYLVSVPRMEFLVVDVAPGTALTVEVTRVWTLGRAGRFEAQVTAGGDPIARGTVTVSEPPSTR